MDSLREHLKQIGEPRETPVAIPGDFHSAPRSLRAAMRSMLSPQLEDWRHVHTSTFENADWTEECQGLTTDGQNWYVSSNNKNFRAIHKFTFDFSRKLGVVELPRGAGNHVGDIDYHDGIIYVPISEPKSSKKVWEISRDLETVRIASVSNDPDPGLGWCAINPWNGYLYTSLGSYVKQIHAYDPSNNYEYEGSLELDGPQLNGLQGGCFSTNGHLYLTSDLFVTKKYDKPPATKDIRGYSALNGAFLGSRTVSYDHDPSSWPRVREEMEGLALANASFGGGSLTHVHVVILDNDDLNLDDVFLQHFAVPDPNIL